MDLWNKILGKPDRDGFARDMMEARASPASRRSNMTPRNSS